MKLSEGTGTDEATVEIKEEPVEEAPAEEAPEEEGSDEAEESKEEG